MVVSSYQVVFGKGVSNADYPNLLILISTITPFSLTCVHLQTLSVVLLVNFTTEFLILVCPSGDEITNCLFNKRLANEMDLFTFAF